MPARAYSRVHVLDLIGIAVFAFSGALAAGRKRLDLIGVLVLAIVTAGGLLRDVLTTEIPLVLRRGDLYASAAIVGTSGYFALDALGVQQQLAAIYAMAIVAAVRLAAIWWRVRLPVFAVDHPEQREL